MGIKLAASCILSATIVATSSISFACDEMGITGIMPENDLRVGMYEFTKSNGMDEKSFNWIIDRVISVYGPVVQNKGGVLKVNRLWTSDVVNASANRVANQWELNMYGGLARHKTVTWDGFMLVVCHELGHQLGGAPKYNGQEWAANEGQADYFGAMKCMRRVLANDDNIKYVRMVGKFIDPVAKKACDSVYKTDGDRALCARISFAGQSLGNLFASLGGKKPKFQKPDRSVVSRTFDGHPKPQCRLDTYFQAALCTKNVAEEVSETDTRAGVCTQSAGFKVGLRPSCWYKPTQQDLGNVTHLLDLASAE